MILKLVNLYTSGIHVWNALWRLEDKQGRRAGNQRNDHKDGSALRTIALQEKETIHIENRDSSLLQF